MTENNDTASVAQTVVLKARDDGRKGYYGADVELLLMDDGTVRWRYNDDE